MSIREGITIGDPWREVPVPGRTWLHGVDKTIRLGAVRSILAGVPVEVLDTRDDGTVLVALTGDVTASERGTILMDAEEELKRALDPAITIYLQPRMDRNALRNLRGVEVKEWRQE